MILLPSARRVGPTAAHLFWRVVSWRPSTFPTDPVCRVPANLRPARATAGSACHRAATAESADGRFDREDSGRADRAKEHPCAKPKEHRSARLAYRAKAGLDRRNVVSEQAVA